MYTPKRESVVSDHQSQATLMQPEDDDGKSTSTVMVAGSRIVSVNSKFDLDPKDQLNIDVNNREGGVSIDLNGEDEGIADTADE